MDFVWIFLGVSMRSKTNCRMKNDFKIDVNFIVNFENGFF